MRLSLIVAALSGASVATAYSAPPMLLKAAEQQGCDLPQEFHIRNFVGQANGTEDAPAPTFFSFSYSDPASKVDTKCQLNATSKSTTPAGLTPRYACDNSNVKFIWGQQNQQLTIVERACLSPQNTPLYEAAGSITISAPCKGGKCAANSTDYKGVFASLQPVRDPNSYKMAFELMDIE
ncbi:hypothetical protein PWT90_07993 [Aphanocladium album]|nr:hypothetical protein PWT90_07993 [Aphanocladium album]